MFRDGNSITLAISEADLRENMPRIRSVLTEMAK